MNEPADVKPAEILTLIEPGISDGVILPEAMLGRLVDLATVYAFGMARRHPFVERETRTVQ